ncbi:hypothetical protein Bca52824_038290 [Brassica carinata]|uniref:Uncharacterized protein n=1 Tax=Brassica carinata TaxID=52824 RepID=A0A8X7UX14_BRACI|nr:hypothetical protein Bca52824_038290 [Brassica carinata]
MILGYEHGVLRNTNPRYVSKLYEVVPPVLTKLRKIIWDRALGLGLERPKSVTMDWLEAYCKKASSAYIDRGVARPCNDCNIVVCSMQ